MKFSEIFCNVFRKVFRIFYTEIFPNQAHLFKNVVEIEQENIYFLLLQQTTQTNLLKL